MTKWSEVPVADQVIPRGGDAIGRSQLIIWEKFHRKLLENKENWTWRRGRPKFCYINLALGPNHWSSSSTFSSNLGCSWNNFLILLQERGVSREVKSFNFLNVTVNRISDNQWSEKFFASMGNQTLVLHIPGKRHTTIPSGQLIGVTFVHPRRKHVLMPKEITLVTKCNSGSN